MWWSSNGGGDKWLFFGLLKSSLLLSRVLKPKAQGLDLRKTQPVPPLGSNHLQVCPFLLAWHSHLCSFLSKPPGGVAAPCPEAGGLGRAPLPQPTSPPRLSTFAVSQERSWPQPSCRCVKSSMANIPVMSHLSPVLPPLMAP